MQDVIHEYVRERIPGRGKQIVGVIVGTVVGGMIVTGWSKCNWKEGDVFNKQEGIDRALARAKSIEPSPAIPVQMIYQFREFQIRCFRYFKQADVLSIKGPYVVKVNPETAVNDILDMINQITNQTGIFGGIISDYPLDYDVSDLCNIINR